MRKPLINNKIRSAYIGAEGGEEIFCELKARLAEGKKDKRNEENDSRESKSQGAKPSEGDKPKSV